MAHNPLNYGTMLMPAQAAMGQFAITDPDSPMGIESLQEIGGISRTSSCNGCAQHGPENFKVVPKELRKVVGCFTLVVGVNLRWVRRLPV